MVETKPMNVPEDALDLREAARDLVALHDQMCDEIASAAADEDAAFDRWSAGIDKLRAALIAHEAARPDVEALLTRIAEAYQVVGALAHYAGLFDDPHVVRALDLLCDPDVPGTMLPFHPSVVTPDVIPAVLEALSRRLDALAFHIRETHSADGQDARTAEEAAQALRAASPSRSPEIDNG